MKITRTKGGIIKMTAESKKDSLNLLQFVENAAGRGSDPNRLSLKKQMQMEIKAGDIVRTIPGGPDDTFLEFEVSGIKNFHGEKMAESEKYGMINVDILETLEWINKMVGQDKFEKEVGT